MIICKSGYRSSVIIMYSTHNQGRIEVTQELKTYLNLIVCTIRVYSKAFQVWWMARLLKKAKQVSRKKARVEKVIQAAQMGRIIYMR